MSPSLIDLFDLFFRFFSAPNWTVIMEESFWIDLVLRFSFLLFDRTANGRERETLEDGEVLGPDTRTRAPMLLPQRTCLACKHSIF